MKSHLTTLVRPSSLLLALATLTTPALAQEGGVDVVPAPATPPAAQVDEDGPRERPGELLPRSAIGPGVIETMDAVMQRQAQVEPDDTNPRARNGAQGDWEVPGMRWSKSPHSGVKHLINRWGDTRMGIGFGRVVDLRGAWIAGQGTLGSWTDGLQAVGYRDGAEVARSEWFETIGAAPTWFAMDLEDVDRVELVARPAIDGSGWYALDDLTYALESEVDGQRAVVLDFEDLPFRTRLTGSGYAGLDWEQGSGDFVQPTEEAPRPQVPPDVDLEREREAGAPDGPKLGGAGTTPSLVGQFVGPRYGDTGATLVPPDTCGAVGTTHFVAATNRNLSIYVKATGVRVLSTSLNTFWSAGGIGDPRVAYDPHHDRFVVIASNFSSRVYFAYSLTGDPTGAWYKTFVNVAQGSDAGKWPDYPTLGVDADGVYFAAFMVGGSNKMSIFAVDKAPLLAATPSMGTVSAWRLLPWEGAIQPCVTYGSPSGEYLVSRRSSSLLRVRRIDGPLSAPTLVEVGSATVPGHGSAPNATQKGTNATLDTIDYRPMNAVFRNGSIWTTHCINVGGRAGVRWYELDPTGPTAAQVGTVSDASLHYYMPGIAVNASGDMVVGFSGSGPNEYPGAYLTGRAVGDPLNETGPPLLYKNGEAPYTQLTSVGVNRWGDYSLTSIDPDDDETFWTIQEFARANNRWGTQIGSANYDCTVGNYCTAKISSSFCIPHISGTGLPSLSIPSAFSITTTDMEQGVSALSVFSLSGAASTPFQGGTLCVTPPVYRMAPTSSGGSVLCGGSISYTLADVLASPGGGSQITVGTQVHMQTWSRDLADPFGSSLSNGLQFDVCP